MLFFLDLSVPFHLRFFWSFSENNYWENPIIEQETFFSHKPSFLPCKGNWAALVGAFGPVSTREGPGFSHIVRSPQLQYPMLNVSLHTHNYMSYPLVLSVRFQNSPNVYIF